MLSIRRSAVRRFGLLALLMVLGSPCILSATSYSCAGSGNRSWHTATDWTPNGIPGAGDTVIIPASCTMQCEANNTCVAGKAGNPGTVDLTIQVGGELIVESGASLDMRGDVTLSGELDIFGGTFTLDPAAASAFVLYYIDGGSDSGADTLKICSESTCASNIGALAVLNCNKGTMGSCQVRHVSHQGSGMNVLGSHGRISNFGTPTVQAFSLTDGALPAFGGFVLKNNFSVHNNGVLQIDYESPFLNLTFDGVSFDGLVDISGSYNHNSFLDLLSLTTPTSGDRTFRVSCADTTNQEASIYLDVVNQALGDSTHPGLVSYNCQLIKGAHGGTFQNVLNVIDRNWTSGTALVSASNTDAVFEDWVMYNHTPNQHHILGTGANGGGSQNTYLRMVFDGDGYSGYDTGDDYQDFGNYTASYGLHINSSGTTFTLGTSGQSALLSHETSYNTYGGTLCENTCTSNMLQGWNDSLFVLPSEILGSEYPGNDGLHNDPRFTMRQTTNSAATDYNFFWQMPGSGDPGANPTKNLHIQLNLGPTPSWVAMTDPGASLVSNQPATMNGVMVTCSNCFVNAQVKDYIVDVTQIPNQYGVIQSITDPSHAILYTSIMGWQSGDHVDVRPAYFATNGLYGMDWGAHDQHIDPWFQDTTRGVCTWWKQQSGSPASCFWPNGNNFTAGAGTGNNIIVDMNVDFNMLGVQNGVDVVEVFGPGWNLLGQSTVLAHTAMTLTVSPINGLSQGDFFTFITAPKILGQTAVQIYGFDVNGNQVTPPAWVNENIVQSIESYVQQGYAPTNLALYGAASDGKTVGAVEVLPPNAAISVSSN
jgi:hypothetical protein